MVSPRRELLGKLEVAFQGAFLERAREASATLSGGEGHLGGG